MNLPRFFRKASHRLLRELRHATAYARARAFDTEPTGEDLVAAWRGLPRGATLSRCVNEWLAKPPPVLPADSGNAERAVREADALLLGNAPVYGEPCPLSLPSLWFRDPRTGQAWPADVHFTRYRVFHPAGDGTTDIRRLWEIGRFGWALPLARAWRHTGREEYAAAWSRYATSFIDFNPCEFGPHWHNAMEVAIRAAQWCRALALLAARPGFGGIEPLLGKALPALLAHGRFIRAHLEWTPYGRTNHFLADLAGLFVLSRYMPQLRESQDWMESSANTLAREIEVQTDADGFHAEASTAYHHFVLELYDLVAQTAEACGVILPAPFRERHAQVRRADAALRGPEDLDPRIGDDDSGTMALPNREARIEERGAGGAGSAPDASGAEGENKPKGSIALKASGLYILRSARLSCLVACGPNGQQGVGGHAHNDKLAVLLRVDGGPVVVDRGTFGYSADPATRNLFRSTAMHSTVGIDGLEQSRMRDWRMLRDEAHARRLVWRDSDTETVFCGEHHGFLPLAARHRRTLQLDKRRHRLFVVDEAEAEGRHEITLRLHLDPSLARQAVGIRGNRVDVPGGWFLFEEGLSPELVEVFHSPVYGTRVPAVCLQLKASMSDRWNTAWEFGIA